MKQAIIMAFLSAGALVAASGGYHVIKEIKIGGEGGWDYATMDSSARRLYVSHATHVVVVDVDAGKVVGDIPETQGVHGIAIAPKLNRGFVSDGRANMVTVFDLKTLKTLGTVKTGTNPDAILYDPASDRVFTFNGRSNDSTVINAKTNAVEGTIPLGGKPEFSAADGKGKAYVNIEDTSEIVELDTKAMTATKRYSLKPCDEPSGLAMDVKNRRLFSVCGNKMMAISDPDTGKLVATPPIGQGPDAAAFDPGTGLAFSSNGRDGTLTVIEEKNGKYEVVETAITQRGARTMALDTKTHDIFLPTADFGPAPATTPSNARPRPSMVPDSFRIIVVGR
jgi:YVTN family beta-propeller protein